ncbi:MAG: DUF1643 domain-containing protein [Candidatus Binatia bacterium]
MRKTAHFSSCSTYRYNLTRTWDSTLPKILFVGLNPSTADDKSDDPTVRRCIGFAEKWGYGGLVLVNLFAYRATDPAELAKVEDPVGPDNDGWIARQRTRVDCVVSAWGNHGNFMSRDRIVLDCLGKVQCLGITKTGCPRHPLYLSATTRLRTYRTNRTQHRTT